MSEILPRMLFTAYWMASAAFWAFLALQALSLVAPIGCLTISVLTLVCSCRHSMSCFSSRISQSLASSIAFFSIQIAPRFSHWWLSASAFSLFHLPIAARSSLQPVVSVSARLLLPASKLAVMASLGGALTRYDAGWRGSLLAGGGCAGLVSLWCSGAWPFHRGSGILAGCRTFPVLIHLVLQWHPLTESTSEWPLRPPHFLSLFPERGGSAAPAPKPSSSIMPPAFTHPIPFSFSFPSVTTAPRPSP